MWHLDGSSAELSRLVCHLLYLIRPKRTVDIPHVEVVPEADTLGHTTSEKIKLDQLTLLIYKIDKG